MVFPNSSRCYCKKSTIQCTKEKIWVSHSLEHTYFATDAKSHGTMNQVEYAWIFWNRRAEKCFLAYFAISMTLPTGNFWCASTSDLINHQNNQNFQAATELEGQIGGWEAFASDWDFGAENKKYHKDLRQFPNRPLDISCLPISETMLRSSVTIELIVQFNCVVSLHVTIIQCRATFREIYFSENRVFQLV